MTKNDYTKCEYDGCFICLEEDYDLILPCCNKECHIDCIYKWWKSDKNKLYTCPYCRQILVLPIDDTDIESLLNVPPEDNIEVNIQLGTYLLLFLRILLFILIISLIFFFIYILLSI